MSFLQLGQVGRGAAVHDAAAIALVLGRFDGTDGQTAAVPNNGTLGGNWAFSGGAALSTTRSFNGTASLKAVNVSDTEVAVLANAGISVPRLTPKALEFRIWLASGGSGSTDTITHYIEVFSTSLSDTQPTLGLHLARDSAAGNFRLYAVAQSSLLSVTPAVLARDAWHHIAISSDLSGVARWFVGGSLISGTSTLSSDSASPTPRVRIKTPISATLPEIWVDDLRYSRDLAYTASFTPPASV